VYRLWSNRLIPSRPRTMAQDPLAAQGNKRGTWKLEKVNIDLKDVKLNRTTRGAPCITFENYKYRFGNRMKGEIRWRCTNKKCKATLKTRDNKITEKRTVHFHEPFTGYRRKKKGSSKGDDTGTAGKGPCWLRGTLKKKIEDLGDDDIAVGLASDDGFQ